MKGIESLYIVRREDGELVFNYEIYMQGSEQYNLAIFSSVVTALTNFTGELEHGGDLKSLSLGNKRIFSSFHKGKDLIFILRCSPKVKEKKVEEILRQIVKKCLYNIDIYDIKPEEMECVKTTIFAKDIDEVLGLKSRLSIL